MREVTVTSFNGQTCTSNNVTNIEGWIAGQLGFVSIEQEHLLRELTEHLEQGSLSHARETATELGMILALTPMVYDVPVDPADATLCEACE